MIKSKKLFSYVAAFIMICLNLTFMCKNLYADVGYLWIESDEGYIDNLPPINSIVKIDKFKSLLIYKDFRVVEKVVEDYEKKSNLPECSDLTLNKGFKYEDLNNPNDFCSVKSLKGLKIFRDYDKISNNNKNFKFISYTSFGYNGIFALVSYSIN